MNLPGFKRWTAGVFCALLVAMAHAGDKPAKPSGPVNVSDTSERFEISPVPVPPGPFDLQICFELAVLRSETLGMKEEDIRVAEARYWQAVGSVLPKIHLMASEQWQNKSGGSRSSVFGGSFDSGSSTGDFSSGGGSSDRFNSRINVKQPLFNGFREFNAAAAGKADIEARRHDKERSFQLLYLDVADVFYQILMYEGDLRVLGEIRDALDRRVGELEKRVSLGKSRPGELLAAKSDIAETQVTVEQIRGLLGASRELLSFLTGVPAAALKLADAKSLPTAEAVEIYLRNTGERPDILAAIEAERSARRQLSAAKSGHWPTISAEGNYYLKEHPESDREWNIFLTFDLPLFEGGVIEARVTEQKALVRSSELNLGQLRRTADKDVKTAYNNFISSMAQVASLKEAEKVTAQNFEIQSRDYELGIVANLDVLDALRQKNEASRRLLDAEMDARVNLIRLHVAAGRLEDQPAGAKSK